VESLRSRQRQYLKGLAHGLSPVVRVGRSGLTQAVTRETGHALRAHELIKVRLDVEDGRERRAMADTLATATGAGLVATIGKVAIFYRARVEDPVIRLPE
jgi:RNA-binding protein